MPEPQATRRVKGRATPEPHSIERGRSSLPVPSMAGAAEKGAGGGRAGGEVERERWRPERLGSTELDREPSFEMWAAGLERQRG
jgi:hypothetical protein